MNASKEIKRLQTLLSYGIIDTPPENEFDNLAELVSIICEVPVAFISLIDDKRQWHKAKIGMDVKEAPIEETFCQHTILQDEMLEIPDARLDDRVKDNPYVLAEEGIRFYAGIPLKAYNGHNIGTVCVVDSKPKTLTEKQKEALTLLTNQVMLLMEARRKNKNLKNELESILEKKIEESHQLLEQKETEFNNLLKAIKLSSGVVEFTPNGYIQEANLLFLKMVGYTRDELKDKHHSFLVNEEQKHSHEVFWKSLKEGKFQTGRMSRRHKNGDEVWIHATYNPILDSNGKVQKVIKISQDITSETASRKALKEAKDLAEQLNVQKDNFIANVSHELRTPIHAILGFTDLLLESEQDDDKKSNLRAVKNAGDTLLFVINDILDLSKLEFGMLKIDAAPFRLRDTIQKVFSILELKAQQKGLMFTYHLDEQLPQLFLGDKNRLSQILINLLGNALKFTKAGSVQLDITVLAEDQEEFQVQFTVSDTGIGIPEDKLEQIFNRFSQADASTARNFGGTGLGLNISKQLVEKQNGNISVQSTFNEGSKFVFTLPFLRVISESKPTSKPEEHTDNSWTNSRILVCEDNDLNQKLMRSLLSEKGIHFTIVHNGREGVDCLKAGEFDLVFMDLQMPEMDGYDAIDYIRNELRLEVPVVALTANFLLKERQKCLQAGMNDYLEKPFSRDELFDKIKEWAQHKPGKALLDTKAPEKKKGKELLNLEILYDLSGGDKVFEAEMLQVFERQTKEIYILLLEASETGNTEQFQKAAHKLKTSFGIIGANTSILEKMEDLLENNEAKPLLRELESQLNEIFCILELTQLEIKPSPNEKNTSG